MDTEQVLDAIERVVLSRKLTPIERFILHQSWHGQTYKEMARDSAYGIPHIKEIGSLLWQELSEAVGERVTKKNLHLVLNLPRTALQDIVEAELESVSPSSTIGWHFPGAPVPLNSPFYINRPPIEELAYQEISNPGCAIRIKAPYKMGKSSLLNRIVARAKMMGYKTAYVDFQEADEAIFTSLDRLLRWFCINISRQLHLDPQLEDYWDEDMGSKVSCKIYFEEYLLEEIDNPLMLAINEIHQVFEHPNIAQDFLPMLRFWHEQARRDRKWQKLRLAISHATEVYVPLNLNQSPFNVGLALTLPYFSLEQMQDLAHRYGLDWAMSPAGAEQLAPLMALIGGHPYLASLAFYHLSQGKTTLENLIQEAPTPAGIYRDRLRGHLSMLRQEPQLACALKQVVAANENVQIEAIAAHKLESMGLIQLEGNLAKPTCELYRLYFGEQLKEANCQL